MHLKALKVFCDVVRHRSFSEAASENDISQPGVSQMVSQLEEHLGVKLIDRSKRPLVPTAEGEVFFEGCRKLVQRYTALEEEVRTLHQEVAGRVSVASIYSVGLSHMNRFVRDFMQKHPKANVRIQYQHPDRVYEMVETDQVDLGLVSYPKVSRTIKAIPWREEPMVLACSPSHRLAWSDEVGLGELDGCDWVSFDPQLQIRRELERVLAAQDVEMRVVMEFDNIETIKRAIEIDAGVGILPEPTLDRELQAGSLVARPLKDIHLTRPVGIIVRSNKELGSLVRLFIQMLGQLGGESIPEGSIGSVSSLSGGTGNGADPVRHKRLPAKPPASA
ncbi:MAG: LysR family transcriptional regulator [Pirellulaceae bacterium]